jgi:hypothetical protein
MGFERNLRQDVTYWGPGTKDGYGGVTFAAPQVFKCRWEDKLEKIVNQLGQEIVSKSRIYLNNDVAVDGYLFLGTSAASDPKTVAGAREIVAIGSIPDLRNLRTLRVAFL